MATLVVDLLSVVGGTCTAIIREVRAAKIELPAAVEEAADVAKQIEDIVRGLPENDSIASTLRRIDRF